MKRLLLLTFFLVHLLSIYGQKGYYVKDGSTFAGIRIIDNGDIQNARQCQVEINEQVIHYSPEEVEEYGFYKRNNQGENSVFSENGNCYLSKKITVNNVEQKVFLERLCQGKINLYYWNYGKGKKFFLEKDSSQLIEIPRKNTENKTYKELLQFYVQDCENVTDDLEVINYTKAALSRFTNQYNTCTRKPFPFFKYGVFAGYTASKPFSLNSSYVYTKNVNFHLDNSFVFGLFMDIPINLSSFSLRPEIYYQKNGFTGHMENSSFLYDYTMNSTSVNIPLLFRYTYPSLKIRPFINIGGTYVYNIKNENSVYIGPADIHKVNTRNLYSDKQIGYSLGGGIQYNINLKKSLFLELRYNSMLIYKTETFGIKSFQTICGINF